MDKFTHLTLEEAQTWVSSLNLSRDAANYITSYLVSVQINQAKVRRDNKEEEKEKQKKQTKDKKDDKQHFEVDEWMLIRNMDKQGIPTEEIDQQKLANARSHDLTISSDARLKYYSSPQYRAVARAMAFRAGTTGDEDIGKIVNKLSRFSLPDVFRQTKENNPQCPASKALAAFQSPMWPKSKESAGIAQNLSNAEAKRLDIPKQTRGTFAKTRLWTTRLQNLVAELMRTPIQIKIAKEVTAQMYSSIVSIAMEGPMGLEQAQNAAKPVRARIWSLIMDMYQAHHDTLLLQNTQIIAELIVATTKKTEVPDSVSVLATKRMIAKIEANDWSDTLWESMRKNNEVDRLFGVFELDPRIIAAEGCSRAIESNTIKGSGLLQNMQNFGGSNRGRGRGRNSQRRGGDLRIRMNRGNRRGNTPNNAEYECKFGDDCNVPECRRWHPTRRKRPQTRDQRERGDDRRRDRDRRDRDRERSRERQPREKRENDRERE